MQANKDRLNLAIVILNYNGTKHLQTFLPSVFKHCPAPHKIYVADNGSTDDSLKFLTLFRESLSKEFQNRFEVIRLEQNLGFAGGYNAALQQVQEPLYLLLNSDVELCENSLPTIIKAFEENPKLGAAMPKIKAYEQKDSFEYAGAAGGYLDYLGYAFAKGRIFDTLELDKGQYDKETSYSVLWASGAALFIRREVFHSLQGFESSYFAHFEEIDLCWRIWRAGYEVKAYMNAEVYHLGGGTLHKSNPKKTYLNFRNSLATLIRNGEGFVLGAFFIRLLLDGVAGLKFLSQGKIADCFAIIRAHFAIYIWLPRLLQERLALKEQLPNILPKGLIYKKSIVMSYYLGAQKLFCQLEEF